MFPVIHSLPLSRLGLLQSRLLKENIKRRCLVSVFYNHQLSHAPQSNCRLENDQQSTRIFLATVETMCIQRRFKKDKKNRAKEEARNEEEEEEESDFEIDDGSLPIGFTEAEVECVNMRLDVASKVAVPISRKRFDDMFLEDKIRVNGERVPKKSIVVGEKDVIDVILGRNKENNELIDIRRVELTYVPSSRTSKDRCRFKVRRYGKMTIPNYVVHPYESYVTASEELD